MPLMSMTGYGRNRVHETSQWMVELRSVNHRYLDLRFRIPRSLVPLEERMRAYLREHLRRGHVEVSITPLGSEQAGKELRVDTRLASSYHEALVALANELRLMDPITLNQIVTLPDVVYFLERPADADAVWDRLHTDLHEALEALLLARRFEGERLESAIRQHVQELHHLRDDIEQRAPKVVEAYRASLLERLQQLMPAQTTIDPTRFREEVLLFAERSDIHEELVRIKSHLEHVVEVLGGDEAAGRKLDFLVQELHREFQTLGVKANDVVIAERVVAAKLELEKCREQVQNIE